MNFPYLIVTTTYPGASPEDVDELVTKPVEEEVSLLSDVKQSDPNPMRTFPWLLFVTITVRI